MTQKEALEALERLFNYCEEIDLHLPEGDPDRTGYNMIDDVNALRHYILFGEEGFKLSIPSDVYSSIKSLEELKKNKVDVCKLDRGQKGEKNKDD